MAFRLGIAVFTFNSSTEEAERYVSESEINQDTQ